MIDDFTKLIEKVKAGPPQTLSVAVAQDEDVLSSVRMAYDKGIIKSALLTGDQEAIIAAAARAGIDISPFEIVHAPEKADACLEAVRLVRNGRADLPMKGFVDTSVVLKALLNRDEGLRTGGLISHVGVLQIEGYDRLFLLSDSAMNIAPSVVDKVKIIENSVTVAAALDIDQPKVAVLCAVEKVNPAMQATLDAQELTEMNQRGEIKNCLVKGPLSLDNAVSPEAARHKGVEHPVAGNADILLMPDIEAGNILIKSIEYFAPSQKAGVIIGAKRPLVLTSRASSDMTKMNSIALGVLVAQQGGKV